MIKRHSNDTHSNFRQASTRILVGSIAVMLAVHWTAPLAQAASQTWDGGGVDANWSTAANWDGDIAAPGATSGTTVIDVATFNAAIANTWGLTGSPILIDSATQNLSSISFNLAAGNYFIGTTGGNSLLLSSGGIVQILNTLTASNAIENLNAPLAIQGGTYTFSNNSASGAAAGAGTLNIGGAVTGGAAGATVLTLSGSNTNANTISGVISDGAATSLSIVKSGAGTWNITANTATGSNVNYSGSTTITGGTLRFVDASNASSAFAISSGATLEFNVSTGVSARLGDGVNVAIGKSGGTTVSGAGTFLKTGSGVLGLDGQGGNHQVTFNMSGGLIDIQAGTLRNGGWSGGHWTNNLASMNIASGANFDIWGGESVFVDALSGGGTIDATAYGDTRTLTVGDNNGSGTFSGIFRNSTGTMGLVKVGTGTQELSGSNTYTGQTSVNAGILLISSASALSSNSNLSINGGVIGLGNGDFVRSLGNGSTQVRFDGNGGWAAFGANRAVNLGGAASTVVWGDATTGFNGNPLILGAASATHTVDFQNALDLGSAGRNIRVDNGAASIDAKLSGSITGSAGSSLNKSGLGTLALSGAINSAVTTNIDAGVLLVTGTYSSSGLINVHSGAALGGTGTVNVAVTVDAGGGIDLRDGATGTLTLGSALTFNGGSSAPSRITFDLGSLVTTTDKIVTTGSITASTAGAVIVSFNQLAGGAFTAGTGNILIQGSASCDYTNFSLATTRSGGNIYSNLRASGNNLVIDIATEVVGPAAASWKGGSDSWSSAANWNTDATSNTALGSTPGIGTNVTFATTTPTASNLTDNTVDADFEINSLNFNAATGGVTIGGTHVLTLDATAGNGNTLANGITSSNTSGTNTISAGLGIGSSQTWTTNGGTLLASGGVSDFGGHYTLTKAGSGTLALSGGNTLSGALAISGGALEIAGSGSLNAGNYSGNISDNGTFRYSSSANQTLSGVISGSGSVVMDGSSLKITGANSYSGGTIINAGTVELGVRASNNLGTGNVTVNAGGTLVMDGSVMANTFSLNGGTVYNSNGFPAILSGAFTLSGISTIDVATTGKMTITGDIGGTGGLTKIGTCSDPLYINGTSNTYTGVTTVSAGALQIKSSIYGNNIAQWTSSNIIVANGATLILNVGGTGEFTMGQAAALFGAIRTVNNNGLKDGSTMGFDTGNASGPSTLSGLLADSVGTGGGRVGLGKFGSGTLALTGANTYSGQTTIENDGRLQFSSLNSVNGGTPLLASSSLGAPTTVANGTIRIGLKSFSGGTLVYTGTGETTDRVVSWQGQGTTLFLDHSGTGLLSFTSDLLIANSGSKNLVLQGSTAGMGELSCAIPDAGNLRLTKEGTGTWTLGGANLYTGTTTINAGTLLFAQKVSLYNNTSASWTDTNIVVNSGATAAFNVGGPGEFSSADIDTLKALGTGGGGFTNGAFLGLDTTNAAAGSFTYASSIGNTNGGANALGVTKLGTNTLVLSGANSYTGATSVLAGVLNIQNATALGSTAAGTTVSSGAALEIEGSGITVGAETLSLAGSGISNGGALRNISGTNTFGGLLTLTGATRINSDAGTLTLSNTGTITGATFGITVGGAGNTVIAGNIGTTTGTLNKDGAGTLTLTGANTFTGTTTLSAGTLAIDSAAALASTALIQIAGGATLTYTGAATTLTPGITVTSGTGTLRNTGGGTLTLSGTLTKNATVLDFAQGAFDVTGSIVGASANSDLVVDSATLTLSATNTYNGPTYIRNGGTLNANITGALPTATRTDLVMDDSGSGSSHLVLGADQVLGSLTGAASSTVALSSRTLTVGAASGTSTFAGTISGTGGLRQDGASTLTLTGTHSYTGSTQVDLGQLTLSTGALGGTDVTVGSGATPTGTAGNATLAIIGGYTLGTSSAGSLTISGGNIGGTPIGQGTLSLVDTTLNTLTLANATSSATVLTLGGSSGDAARISLELGNSGTDKIVLGQNLLLNAGGAILSLSQLAGTTLVNGTYDLLTFGAGSTLGGGAFTFVGNATTMAIGGGRTFTLQTTGTAEQLVVAFVANPNNAYWSGAQGTIWSTLTGSNNSNWVNGPAGTDSMQVPGATTNVFFTANSAANFSNTTLGADFTINSLNFTGSGTSATASVGISGNTLTINATNANGNVLGSGITVESGSGSHTIGSNLVLGNDQTWGNFSTNTLTLSGVISGAHTLALNGAFTFSGTTANTYSGTTTLNGGTLQLSKTAGVTAINGDLVVAGGTAQLLAANQINNSAAVTLSGGTLALGAHNETVGTVTLASGSITGTTGTLTATSYDVRSGSISAILGGSGVVLTKSTGSTVTLTAANAYTGGTNIAAGTLNFTTGGLGTSGAVTFTGNSTLQYGAATTTDLSARLAINSGVTAAIDTGANNMTFATGFGAAGTGALTKLGSGTLTLSGANTYTGTTTVGAGLVKVTGSTVAGSAVSGGALGGTGSVGGAVTLSGTGGIDLVDGAIGTLTLGSTLDITGLAGANNLFFDLGASSTDQITVAGSTSVTTAGAAVINLNQIGAPIATGTYTLIQGTGAMAAAGQFSLASSSLFGLTFSLSVSGNNLQLTAATGTIGAANAFWKGGANNWTTASNWNTDATSGTALGSIPGIGTNVTFATTTPVAGNLATNIVDADFEINSLTFNAAAGGVTIGGTRTLTLDATAANGNGLGNGITAFNTRDTNTIAAKIGLGASQTWTTSGGSLFVSGVVSDFGAGYTLTKAGAGTLTLSGANTYTGATLVSVGVLDIRNATALGTIGAGTTVSSGATLQIQGGISIGAEALSLAGSGAGGHGALRNLSGTNTFGGLLTLTADAGIQSDAGTLTLSNVGTISGAGFGMTISGAGDTTIDSIIGTGTGTLTKTGSGTLTLTGPNTYTGTTNLRGGTISVASTSALSASAGIHFRNSAALVYTGAAATLDRDITVSAATGTLRNSGSGTLTLSGALSHSGATLEFSGGAFNVTGSMTGAKAGSDLIVNGATVTLSAANSYNGTTALLNGATLNANVAGALPTATRTALVMDAVGSGAVGSGSSRLVLGGGANQALASLTGAASSTVDLGSSTLTIGASSVPNGIGNFAGLISGAGALVKDGASSQTLSGANTYSGGTVLAGGNLILANAAALGTGDVRVNAGTLRMGGNALQARIGGNYTQGGAGTLALRVQGVGASDHLAIAGRARLGGTLSLLSNKLVPLQLGDSIELLRAAGGVSGAFGDVQNGLHTGTIVETKVVTDSNAVRLETQLGSFAQAAAAAKSTPNQLATAAALDGAGMSESKLLKFLSTLPLASLPASYDQIAPEELSVIYQQAFASARAQNFNIEQRLIEVRAGARGFSASGLRTSDLRGADARESASALGSGASADSRLVAIAEAPGTEATALNAPSQWAYFISGDAQLVDVESTTAAHGYDLQTGGVTVGADYRVSGNLVVGLTSGYARTTSDLSGGGHLEINGGAKAAVYASLFGAGFYSNAIVGGGANRYDIRRAGLGGDAHGETAGREFNAQVSGGYDWHRGGLSFGPDAALRYSWAGIDGYKERGSLAPLQIEAQSAQSLQLELGVHASYGLKLRSMLLTPNVRVAWQHEALDTNPTIASRFLSGAGGVFGVRGTRVGSESLLVSGGISLQVTPEVSGYVNYNGEFLRTNIGAHQVNVGMRLEF